MNKSEADQKLVKKSKYSNSNNNKK
jgi:hypothetical protein